MNVTEPKSATSIMKPIALVVRKVALRKSSSGTIGSAARLDEREEREQHHPGGDRREHPRRVPGVARPAEARRG